MSPMSDTTALLDMVQVATRLGVSRRTVERFAASGDLRCIKFGTRAIRFDPADVEAFIAARKTAPTDGGAS